MSAVAVVEKQVGGHVVLHVRNVTGDGRRAYISHTLNKMLQNPFKRKSDEYAEQIPEGVRKALARAAGVEMKPLAEMTRMERRKLEKAARDLSGYTGKALLLIVVANSVGVSQ